LTAGNNGGSATGRRAVPRPVRVRLLFGGTENQVGWAVLAFGLTAVWMFTVNSDLTSWYYFEDKPQTTKGKILWSRETHFFEGGSSHSVGGTEVSSSSSRPIYAIGYAFTADGKEYEGTSYQSAGSIGAGTQVTVQYVKGRPNISRIEGMRRAPVGLLGGALSPLFALAALIIITRGLRKGLRGIRLLSMGKMTTGRLISKKTIGPFGRHQKDPVYKLVFEFTDEKRRTHRTTTQTQWTERLEDEEKESLLYDPARPGYAVLLDDLPASPRIDDNGNIILEYTGKRYLYLLIPAVTIAGHGLYGILYLLL
jgi:hypothetical protein